ncbi:MAG: sulfotransferase [Thermomonas sp.]
MAAATLIQTSERAERHVQAGNWDAARREWLSALVMAPNSAEVKLELSYVESLAGHYRVAHEWALRAAQADPRSIDEVHTLMRRLRTFNESQLVRTIVLQLLDQARTPATVLVECAKQLTSLNDFGLALQCAQAATARAPEDIPARLVRGQLLAHHGRIDEASSDFNWALRRNPGVAIGWWMLARLSKQTPQSNHVGQLRALLATPGLHPEPAAALARALHKELDDIGAHGEAWTALEMLCKAKRTTERYDRKEHIRLVDALMTWEPQALEVRQDKAAGKTPLFVVGMHRSGTTLLEQLLSASPQVLGLGELNDFTSAMRYQADHYCKGAVDLTLVERAQTIDFTAVGQRYRDGLAWRLGEESFFVDKQPSNFLNIGFICQALPNARILHMVRDPVETCFSNLRELFTEINPHSYDQHELADYFIQYRRLMAHWHARFPGRILDVDYAELTRNPEAVMREVAAFCGIDYIDAMCDPRSSNRAVATASSVQVRDKVVRREVPKWAPYARQLQPLISALRQGGVDIPELPA